MPCRGGSRWTPWRRFEIGKAELGRGEAAQAGFSGRSSCRFNSQMRSKVSFRLR